MQVAANKSLGKYGYHKQGTSTNRSTPSRSSSSTSRHTQGSNRNYTATKEVAPEGSIKYFNDKISENKAKIELSINPKERAKL